MLAVVGVVGAAALALFIYVRREHLGVVGGALAALRTVALAALIVLAVNPGWARSRHRAASVVLLDVSLSMGSDMRQWQTAVDTARVVAGSEGMVLAFGRTVRGFEGGEPSDGVSRLNPALHVARGLGRRITVVTDGELTDAELVAAGSTGGVELVLVPRDTVASAALVDVDVPPLVSRGDSLFVIMTVGVFGNLASEIATLEVTTSGRNLLRQRVALPRPPASVRRLVALTSSALRPGPNVLEFRLTADGDREPRDDMRWRIVHATDQAAVVVISDPADWEGRLLTETFARVSGSPVRGFARIADSAWVDTRSLTPVLETAVARAARSAGLLVLRGARHVVERFEPRQAWWWWPSGHSKDPVTIPGDWYVDRDVGTSPLAPTLARSAWDSVPPLTAVASVPVDDADWVALRARLGRRGAARPVLVGGMSGSRRRLVTSATGFARWALRGDLGSEAVRTVTAAGMDWLLQSGGMRAGEITLASGGVAMHGTPLRFVWTRTAPDSAVVRIQSDGESRHYVLYPDPAGEAELWLAPGMYDWSVEGAPENGVAAVEPYSVEFTPQAVTRRIAEGSAAGFADFRFARQRWWVFAVALLALLVEWAWRQRRGLP